MNELVTQNGSGKRELQPGYALVGFNQAVKYYLIIDQEVKVDI